jgi:hypothetical protein
MNGNGRRAVVVGVVLATTMSAGVAVAADPGIPVGFLKAALTTPADRDTAASSLLQSAFNQEARHYSLPADARLTISSGGGEMSRIARGVAGAEELGAGGYASSLRAVTAENGSGPSAFADEQERAESATAAVDDDELQAESGGTLDILPAIVAGSTSGTTRLSGHADNGSAPSDVSLVAAALQGETGTSSSLRLAQPVVETGYTPPAREIGVASSEALSAPSAEDALGRCAQTLPDAITGIAGDTVPAIQVGGSSAQVALSGGEPGSGLTSYIAPPRQSENEAEFTAQSGSSRLSYIAAPLDNSSSAFANVETAATDLAELEAALVGAGDAGASFSSEHDASLSYTALPTAKMRQ